MKNLFSKIISILAVSALLSIALVSCADLTEKESGSVSFSLSPEVAKAALSAGRSARAETDPNPEPTGSDDTESEKPYRIEVAIHGVNMPSQSRSYTEKEFEAISNGTSTDKPFVFDSIPVGMEVSVSATIYLDRGGHLVWPCMTGSSSPLEIESGENQISFNVHKLAMVNLYNNTESGETISDISKLDVYALPKGSGVANKILALVAKDDSKNDPEIYEILSAYSKIYSYSKLDSPYLTGGYELKNGAEVYMLSLLYTSDGVYLGHPDVSSSSETLPQDALTVIKIDEVNYIHLKLMKMDLAYTYIFPAKYEDKEVSAWYVGENYDGQADYHGTPCIKTETSAVFLFSDKTFVSTSHKIKKSTSGEEIYEDEIKYFMRGNYELSGDDFANGTFTLTPTAKYVKLVCEVTNGKFTPSFMEEPYEFSMKSDSDYLRVYRGEIDDAISAFLPKKFADRTVAAWYAYYGSDYTEAVFLFAEGEFVTTKHKYSQNSGEVREILAAGEYSLSGTPNDYDNNTGTAQFKDGDDEKVVTIRITNGVLNVSEMSSDSYARQSLDALPTPEEESSGEHDVNLDIIFLFETEIGSGKYEELDKLPTLHINADYDIDSVVESYTTQAIMLGYDYNDELTDDEPYFNKETNVWIMRIYFDKVEIKEVFSATGQGTSDSITLSEKHSFTLTSYSTLTYEVKYSDGDSITDKVVSKGTWALSDDKMSYIITETEYYDFKAETLVAVKEPNPQTVSMANLNENGKFTYKSANGVEIMFTITGDEPTTVTIGGVSVTLAKVSFTDEGENVTVNAITNDDGSITLEVSCAEGTVVTKYVWMIEGENYSLSNDGGSEYVINADLVKGLNPGVYNLTLVATINDEPYSVNASFTVTNKIE